MFSALDPYPYGAGALAITTLCCLLIMLVASEMAMPAGLFLPTVYWGGAFGSMFGLGSQYVVRTLWGEEQAQTIAPGTYALVGCTAGLAGVFHSNISLVVIILEVHRGPDSSVCLACDLSPQVQDPSSFSSEPTSDFLLPGHGQRELPYPEPPVGCRGEYCRLAPHALAVPPAGPPLGVRYRDA